jgi:hypothetical protein
MAWTRARYPLPLFQSGPHTNIQDPGFRFAPPWAEVHYAFGVFPKYGALHRFKSRAKTVCFKISFKKTQPENPTSALARGIFALNWFHAD